MIGSRYASLFTRLAERGEGAFVPFVVLGDPTPDLSADIIDALVEGGADALELGIPFSDPIADGPTIQTADARALAAGVTPDHCWELLTGVRARHPDVPIGLLVYANLAFGVGLDRFYERARRAGVDAILVADVPVAECAPFVEAARAHEVAPVLIAPPNASDAQLAAIARTSEAFTYVVTRRGVTGAGDTLDLQAAPILAQLRALDAPPPLLGFGISAPPHVRAALDAGAAGAISGSAVVTLVNAAPDDPEALLPALTAFVRDMKAATRRSGG